MIIIIHSVLTRRLYLNNTVNTALFVVFNSTGQLVERQP